LLETLVRLLIPKCDNSIDRDNQQPSIFNNDKINLCLRNIEKEI